MQISPPFDSYLITQAFAENPGAYDRFGYPGHNGIDLWTHESPALVMCVYPGVVEKVGWEAEGYGKFVVVLHSASVAWRSYYAHLKSVHCKPGQEIKQSHFIGEMGSTGNSTGPHLHLGIRFPASFNPPYKGFIDPYPLLRQGALPVAPLVDPPYPQGPEGGVEGTFYVKPSKPKLPGSVLIGTWGKKTMYRMKKYF